MKVGCAQLCLIPSFFTSTFSDFRYLTASSRTAGVSMRSPPGEVVGLRFALDSTGIVASSTETSMAECSSDKVPAGYPPSTPYGTFLPHSSPLPTAPPLPSPPKVPLPTAPLLQYPPKAPLQYQSTPQPAGGYHAIPVGYQFQPFPNVVDGIPMNTRVPPLPFCGIGVGWALFVAGFFFASIPWYVGAFILLFVSQDHREKPGLIACSIAAVLTILSLLLNAFNFHVFW